MRNIRALARALLLAAILAATTAVCAQGTRITFPNTGSFGTAPAATTPIPPAGSPYGSSLPAYGGTGPITGNAVGSAPGASSVYSQPGFVSPPALAPQSTVTTPYAFDPYSTSPGIPNPWSTTPPPAGTFPPPTTPFVAPSTGGFAPPASPFSSQGLTTPGTSPYINSGAYPSQSSNSLFPNGFWGSNTTAQPYYDYNQALKLVQDTNLTHTFLGSGNDPTDVSINDTYTWVTFAFPNFLGFSQPLYIAPSFGLHLWDGPHSLPADLPPNAYSAFLDAQYFTDPNLQLGGEVDFRIGVYTDFNTFNSHSLRIQGLGLGTLKITPTLTLKLGAKYIDRNDIKILPAGGIMWQPSNRVRFDFYFPDPKLASYLTTIDTYELWWYVRGEYGGGAWTIKRTSGVSDRMDINDIRVALGMETIGPGPRAFAEIGYVFDRDVIYVVTPSDSFKPANTIMVRAGFSF